MRRMLPRFFAPDLAPDRDTVELPPEEARHLLQVLRLRAGDEIAVFDGRGHEYRARIDRADRRAVRVGRFEPVVATPEPRVRLTVAQAVLKGEHMDDAVRDLVMMGAAVLQPVASRRTTLDAQRLAGGRAVARWRRIAIASVKQCGRAVLPEIATPIAFGEAVGADRSERKLILVEPSAERAGQTALGALGAGDPPASATLAIGPEGGWAPEEIELAVDRGFAPITLGRRTLRADAVPIVAMGVLLFLWGDF